MGYVYWQKLTLPLTESRHVYTFFLLKEKPESLAFNFNCFDISHYKLATVLPGKFCGLLGEEPRTVNVLWH